MSDRGGRDVWVQSPAGRAIAEVKSGGRWGSTFLTYLPPFYFSEALFLQVGMSIRADSDPAVSRPRSGGKHHLSVIRQYAALLFVVFPLDDGVRAVFRSTVVRHCEPQVEGDFR